MVEAGHNVPDDTDDEEVDVESGVSVQVPRGLPAPPQPSKEEKSRHDLTHTNYRSWCPHCVFGRRNNTPHEPPNPVDVTFPCFAPIIVSSEMSMILTMCLVWLVDSIHRKPSLPLPVIERALTTQWSSASRTLSRRAVYPRWLTTPTKNQLFGQPLKKRFDVLVDQTFSNPLMQFQSYLQWVDPHPMARPKG